MAVRPGVRGGGKPARRPSARPAAEVAAVPAPVAPVEAESTPAPEESTDTISGSTSVAAQYAAPMIPRWLLLLVGLAAATIAVAGMRAVAWLVAPVFLALA